MKRPELRTFEDFPADHKCIVCGTNEDDRCVLITIDGTSDGRIAEEVPVHLACAVSTNCNNHAGIIYRRTL
jgi:hypothetical protein